MEGKCFCYLDILGFSKYIKDDSTEFASDLLNNYNTVLKFKILEENMHPIASYSDEMLRDIAIRNSVSSFNEFAALSDSIFIEFDDADTFIEQLSSFLCDSFNFTSNNFLNPKDCYHPEKTIYTVIHNSSGKALYQERSDYPLLMRGAISYGEVIHTTSPLIHNKSLSYIPNYVGKAVVEAVKLGEMHGYGPYLFVTDKFFEQLSDNKKKYVKEIDKHKYFLWPINFITNRNDYKLAKINEVNNTLKIAANLYKAFANLDIAKYYQDFLKLCIESFKALFNNEQINSDLKEIIREQNIDYSIFNLDC